MGPNLVPRGPPRTSGAPKRGISGQKVPFRTPRGPEGARYQVKVCLEFKPAGPIGGSWDQICPPWTLRGSPGPQMGPFGAQKTLFAYFLELCGSIWAITVLDEPGIPLRFSGHPTGLYFEKKFPHKIGPWKFRASGHFGPNGALLGPPGTCLLYTSPSPRDATLSRMPSSA